MNRTLIRRALRDKRRTIIVWCLAIAITNMLLALLFPAIRDTMGSMTMSSIPAGMENWFGQATTWQTYTGYAGQELFGQMAILLIIMAIVFGIGLIAGYEKNGTLRTVLSRPVSRQSLYVSHIVVLAVAVSCAAIAFYSGVVLGGLLVEASIEFGVLAQCMVATWLLALTFGVLAYAIGAITGRSTVAGMVIGFYAFVAYVLASLSTMSDTIDTLSHGSLFRYASAPAVIANGLSLADSAVLFVVLALAAGAGVLVFMRRDIRIH